MRLHATQTTTSQVNVDVDPLHAFEELKKLVYSNVGLRHDWYLNKSGQIVEDEDNYTSHSWTDTKVRIETPTEEQLAVINSFSCISKLIYKTILSNGSTL